MKRIYLSMAILAMASSAFGQEFEKRKLWVCMKEVGAITTKNLGSKGQILESSSLTLNNELRKYKIKYFKPGFPRVDEIKQSKYTEMLKRVYELECDGCDIESLENAFHTKGEGVIDYAERIPVYELAHTPNDYYLQFGEDWELDAIKAKQAWDITKGSSSIKIAIVDTDYNTGHEDLTTQYTLVDGTYTGDFPQHGTAVAGQAACATNNGKGISSIGYNCKLMLYKNFGLSRVVDAAADGADIINMSWGHSSANLITENTTINAVYTDGVILVGASGNASLCGNTCYFYPASYDHVISVTGVNKDLIKPTGWIQNDRIDVSAPGAGVVNLTHAGGYVNYGASGSSYAAPNAAGLAGLILSVRNCFTSDGVEFILRNTARDISHIATNGTQQMGTGLINAYEAVRYARDLPIVGPDIVCHRNTIFSLPEFADNVTVTWSKSRGLQYVSGQGTSNYVVKSTGSGGSGWVRAQISGCGTNKTVTKTVYLNKPVIIDLQLQDANTNIPIYSLCHHRPNYLKAVYRGSGNPRIDDWGWKVPSGWTVQFPNSADKSIAVITPFGSGGEVEIRTHNACGWTSYIGYYMSVVSCGSFFVQAVPNPVENELTVLVEPEMVASKTNNLPLIKGEYTVTLHDNSGIKRKNIISSKRKLTINVSDLPEGLYVLTIVHAEGVEKQKLYIL